jgi:hypothetical protein
LLASEAYNPFAIIASTKVEEELFRDQDLQARGPQGLIVHAALTASIALRVADDESCTKPLAGLCLAERITRHAHHARKY